MCLPAILTSLSSQSFIYSPTDALVSCLKKTILKFTLKQLRHVSVLQLHHHQGAHWFVLMIVTVVKIQSNLSSWTPRITNSLVYKQIFWTQSVSDDVLCLKLRTRKPSKCRQKQITLDNFLVRQRPSGSEAESSGAKRQKKKKNPLPNNNISLPHHLPLTPSTLLHTGTVKLN